MDGDDSRSQRVLLRALDNPELELRSSRFASVDALWLIAERREIAHVDSEAAIDVRVGRHNIRRYRAEWQDDGRFAFRSSASDWVMFEVRDDADIGAAVALIELACDANRR